MDDMLYNHNWIAGNDRFVWYINFEGLLMQVEIETGEHQCLGLIPYKNENRRWGYVRIAYVRDRLILVPNAENDIIEYDLVHNKFIAYDIPEELKKINEGKGCLFVGVCQHNGVLYMYGYYPVVVGYDVEKHTFKIYKIDASNTKYVGEQYFFSNASTIIGQKLLIATLYFTEIIQIDLIESTVEYVSIMDCNQELDRAIVSVREKIYVVMAMLGGELRIIEYDKEMNYCNTKSYQLPQRNGSNFYFEWIGAVDDKIILLAGQQDFSYAIDINEDSMSMLSMPVAGINWNDRVNAGFANYRYAQILNEKEIVTINAKLKELVLLDVEKMTILRKEIKTTNRFCDQLKKAAEKILMEDGTVLEKERYITMEDFVKMSVKNVKGIHSVGKNIWKEMVN